MIVELSAVGRDDLPRVGGKGASLGQRLRDGLPLPDGFVITAQAYRHVVDVCGLNPAIARALAADGVDRADPAACEAASSAIRAAFDALVIPPALSDAILARWNAHGAPPVAVRSSATAEDLPDASFAGQQETVLGVRAAPALLDAVRRCWSSLWTARAIAYRGRQGFDHREVTLAVVVQRLVEPEAAGVLFTIDPVHGADEMLVNASWGLGESVVSGLVTPDLWRLARADGRALGCIVGSKERQIRAIPEGGTVTEPVTDERRARACLPDAALAALYHLGRRIEAAEGRPQDIEFAWADGQIFLLQSRPITTRPAPLSSLTSGQRRMLDDLLEHYPSPPLPLDEEPLQRGYDQLLQMARDAGIGFPDASEILRVDDDGVFRAFPVDAAPGLGLWRLPGVLGSGWGRDPAAWAERVRAQGVALPLTGGPVTDSADVDALWREVQRGLDAGYAIARVRFAEVILPSALWGAWLTALARVAGHTVDPFAWLGGLRYRTVDVEHGLQVLADIALADDAIRTALDRPDVDRCDPWLPDVPGAAAWRDALAAFLDEHGDRTAVAYLPFSTRSWREDPAGVLLAARALVRAGQPGAAAARTAAGWARYDALVHQVASDLPGLLRPTFWRTLDRYRQAHVAREASLYAIEQAYGIARRAMQTLAASLAKAGTLTRPEHVVFARKVEIAEWIAGRLDPAELRRRIGRRRARREAAIQAWRSQRPPPPAVEGALLRGTAGSPGFASGPARVILGVEDFGKLQPGDVLVCPYTDPTWTPLFSLAAAVVSDTGGPLSHAAIVAREYGIPAVLGTEVGTQRASDGASWVVDGRAGVVRAAVA